MFLALSVLVVAVSSALAATDCNGNISNLSPTGKRIGGVAASQADVSYRLTELNSMKSCYDEVANRYCIPASVIGALASRESNGGASLTPDGYGDNGNAWGILQCDLRYSGLPCKQCGPRTCCHIDMMIGRLLVPYIRQVSRKFPSWTPEMKLQGAVAAYNFGVSNVQSWSGLDVGSTGNDFSNDVMARAQYLKSLGWS
ncbi:glycine, glutamate and proline-rich protein-like [Pomacea canaliculata]|uniref:glycine, glutamate and proline-rich protein-like n=1 Tax=Pomacea canaliculata TaxID=400727 RepID=UPI000D731C8D|nr:glycine, glutamate and proline-rich protein-like [Pomacea canaliculata]